MKQKQLLIILLLPLSFLVLTGCAAKTRVERVPADSMVDFSGYWNDYDAQTTAAAMIDDALMQPWIDGFLKNNGRNPVLIVGHVANRTHEHINTQVISKQMEQSLLRSGRVSFVASAEERDGLRNERDDQQRGYTDPETIKAHGREVGADYVLIGSVNSVKDEVKGRFVIFYQVNLEIIDLATNMKVWFGQEPIKKVVKRSRFSF